MKAPSISIVVTSHNEREALLVTLDLVSSQIAASGLKAEIVVVDDRSTDGTAMAVSGLALQNLKLLRIDDRQDKHLTARQLAVDLAIRNAFGEIIVIVDADAIPSLQWLPKIVAPIFTGESDAVAGPVAFAGNNSLIAAWQSADTAYYHTFCAILNASGIASGVFFGNFAFRKKVYEDVGGFEQIGFALTEDLAFARALRAKGFRLAYSTDQIVEVAASPNWRTMIDRMARVTSGGFSAMALAITTWMLALPALAFAALLFGGIWEVLFLVRYFAGVAITATGLLRTRQWFKAPMAFLHDIIGLVAGSAVALRVFANKRVEWGGHVYRR